MSINTNIPALVSQLLVLCGSGRFLTAGTQAKECASTLWQHNAQATTLTIQEAHLSAAVLSVPALTDNCCDAAILLHILDRVETTAVTEFLNKLFRACSRYVCILADITYSDIEGNLRDTAWWEAKFFSAGFRLHPRSFHILGYPQRENPPSPALLCFEKIRSDALIAYPFERLHAERLLHMDMLRDSGRRSDAHVYRYFVASRYIRPGDTVLDCACGLGYGSHILYQNSRARRVIGVDPSEDAIEYAQLNYNMRDAIDFYHGDALNLSAIADNSIDFVAGFGTIEHVPEPEVYLKEILRVLRPAGRVLLSAPCMWVDETGKNFNPHHLRMYTWEKLYRQVARYFLPERGFIQMAGGAMKLPQTQRHWEEVTCHPYMGKDAEWILLLGMKDPLLGRDVPYMETTFPESNDPAYYVGAFGKDYLNPCLLKGMISRGFRLENPFALQKTQEGVLSTYPLSSVDYGAALCGRIYALFESAATLEEGELLLQQADDYIANENTHPHVLRWKVSLLFVIALFQQKHGNLEQAEELFMRCAAYDVEPFSALLGNKTLDALYNAAMLALVRSDVAEAERRLRRGITEAQRLVQGSWLNITLSPKTPFEPGLPEIAQLMDKASRCCYALGELHTHALRPGLSYQVGQGWFEGIINQQACLIGNQQEVLVGLMHQLDRERNSKEISENYVTDHKTSDNVQNITANGNLLGTSNGRRVQIINFFLPPGTLRRTVVKTLFYKVRSFW